MRDYGRVFSAFWQSPEARSYSEDGRTLALYLLTSPHTNLIGCFRLPLAYAADDLQWPIERVSEGFRNLSERGFVVRDDPSQWVFVRKYLQWNAFENPNVAKTARKAFDQVPDGRLKGPLARAIHEFGAHLEEGFRNLLETLSEPFAKPEPEPEPEPIQSLSPSRAEPLSPGVASQPRPSRKPCQSKPGAEKSSAPSAETWAAYADAYAVRYGAIPVRNAAVNGQIAHLVGRIGGDEAPGVARFYLSHQNRLYVNAMHPTNLLLRDCEKLRTEWVTQTQMTSERANQMDRTQTNFNAFAPLIAAAEEREREERERAQQ